MSSLDNKALMEIAKKKSSSVIMKIAKILANPFSPGALWALKELYDEYKTIPDQLFLQKLSWFLNETQNFNFTNQEKLKLQEQLKRLREKKNADELSFMLMDLINKAFDEKQIQYLVNALMYSLAQENDSDNFSDFYGVAFLIQNTNVNALPFLIENIKEERVKRKAGIFDISRDVYYRKNFFVDCLVASGLMFEAIIGGWSPSGHQEDTPRYSFTNLGYKVFEYITYDGKKE